MLWESAPAKVNLYLHVTGRRADGYHLLDSLAVFPAIGDRLGAVSDVGLSLEFQGPFGGLLATELDNLVLRAARLLADRFGRRAGARMVLEKNLPIASGIGGGSADAAAALRLLARLWSIRADAGTLHDVAVSLGADVPVCLESSPARMQGIGDMLLPAPDLPSAGMVLVNPGMAIATPEVFREWEGGFTADAMLPSAWPDAFALARDLRRMANDLEPAARRLCPTISRVLAELGDDPTCLLARMSGSGATCFGLFADADAACLAAARLQRKSWWVWGGEMAAGLPARLSGP